MVKKINQQQSSGEKGSRRGRGVVWTLRVVRPPKTDEEVTKHGENTHQPPGDLRNCSTQCCVVLEKWCTASSFLGSARRWVYCFRGRKVRPLALILLEGAAGRTKQIDDLVAGCERNLGDAQMQKYAGDTRFSKPQTWHPMRSRQPSPHPLSRPTSSITFLRTNKRWDTCSTPQS